MDFDITFRGLILFGFEVRFYSIMILSGLFGGILLAQVEAKRLGENPAHVMNIAMLGAACALVGARLYHVVDEWAFYSANPGQIFALRSGGIGIFGAIVGAAFAVVAYTWWVNRAARRGGRQPMSALRWLDIGAPAFLLGQAIGRWGNFFNQELFGPPTDLPWGIPIELAYRPAQYYESTHFHPLFLYESLLSLLGVAVLLYVGRRFALRLRQGDILLLYLVWYSVERSALEVLRIDNWKIGPVPTAHFVALVLVLLAIAAFVWWRRGPYLAGGGASSDDSDAGQSRSSQRRARRRTAAPSQESAGETAAGDE